MKLTPLVPDCEVIKRAPCHYADDGARVFMHRRHQEQKSTHAAFGALGRTSRGLTVEAQVRRPCQLVAARRSLARTAPEVGVAMHGPRASR
jgi:hypothetical protein